MDDLWQQFVKHEKIVPLKKKELIIPVPENPNLPSYNSVSSVIDLHGMTIQEAYDSLMDLIYRARNQHKFLKVITGKSGQIRSEFLSWINNHPHVKRYETLNGDGSFKVFLK